MLLSIIIINFKTFELTKNCVESIKENLSDDFGKNLEVIVVDNGSGEEVDKLQKLRDQLGFKLVLSDINLGFGAGCNFGSQMAKGENLLFLNSDAKLKSGIIEMADQLNRENDLGILGGKIIDENGNLEKSAGKFYNLWRLFLMLIGGQRFGLDRFAPQKFEKVDFVSGGFMMVKKDVFEKLSGFDEKYFMYLEDMDLCLRALKTGFKTYYYPDAQVIHRQHGSSSRGFAILNIYRSLKIFYKKNRGEIEYNIAIYLLFSKALFAYILGIVLNRQGLKATYREVLNEF